MAKFRQIDIEEVQDVDAFSAWGYVVLKVMRGDEIVGIRVKIGSVPQEDIDLLRKKTPKPPGKTVMLDPTNPDHAALGITTRQKGIIPDFNDDKFRIEQEEFDVMFRREVVGKGVRSGLTLKDGRPAVTPEERYKALEERGISGIHFSEIAQQILNLTSWTEDERTNFLTTSSASEKEKSATS
jgi:hypothetical protein